MNEPKKLLTVIDRTLPRIILARMDPKVVAREIEDFIIDEVEGSQMTGCVIGLSGGVDSTTTAALAKRAFDMYNGWPWEKKYGNLELVGYILPTTINDPTDTRIGEIVAQKLGIRYEIISLDQVVEAYRSTNPEAFDSGYHKGNMISRIRANVLSTKAATERKLVLGTGNKDEDFGIGYYTLFGDGAVHLSPIGNLPKRLVKEMAAYMGWPDIANKEPTAGLEVGQTDFGDLGYSYDSVELVLEAYSQGIKYDQIPYHWQIYDQMKDELPRGKRFDRAEDAIKDILRRHWIAEGKSKIIHPPIAPITLKYNND